MDPGIDGAGGECAGSRAATDCHSRRGDGSNASRMLEAMLGFHVPQRAVASLVNVAALLEWDHAQRRMVNLAVYGVLMLAAIVMLVRFRRQKVEWWLVGLLLLIAMAPYVWYTAVAQHSMQHYWFTYRNQMVTMVAVGCACVMRWSGRRWVPRCEGACRDRGNGSADERAGWG